MPFEPLDLDVDYLVEEYLSGRSANDLASELGCSIAPITDRLKDRGIEIRGPKSQIDEQAVVEAYQSGKSRKAVARAFDVTFKVVDRIVQDAGIEPENRRLVDLPEGEVVRLYEDGIGAGGVAKRFGCSASVVTRILRENGVHIRNRSEQQFARMARATDGEIRQLTAAAHEAARGRTPSMEELCKAAKTRERRQSARTSPYERRLKSMLVDRGLDPTPQKAIGPYNCDMAIEPVAVEVFGGGWHWHGDHLARSEDRIRHILDAGWYLLMVAVDGDRFPLTAAVADYVVSEVERARSDPSLVGQYRVVWGAGERSTGGSVEDDDISIEPPFGGAHQA